MDEQTKRGLYTSSSVLKRKELQAHSATRMNLQDNVLSDISQSQKDKDYYDSAYRRSPESSNSERK